jgi:hypothetical protein
MANLLRSKRGQRHANGLFVRRDALNGYLAQTQRTLVYRRFANRGLFSQAGRDGSQIDLLTWKLLIGRLGRRTTAMGRQKLAVRREGDHFSPSAGSWQFRGEATFYF